MSTLSHQRKQCSRCIYAAICLSGKMRSLLGRLVFEPLEDTPCKLGERARNVLNAADGELPSVQVWENLINEAMQDM